MGVETVKELNVLKIDENGNYVLNKDNGVNSVVKSNETKQHFNVCKNIDDETKSPLNQKDNSLHYFDANCKVTLKFKNDLLKLIADYEDIFKGHGKLKNFQCKLHVDENIQPIAQNLRRYPYHLRKDIRAKLRRLEEADINEKVEGPQEWISSFVKNQSYGKIDGVKFVSNDIIIYASNEQDLLRKLELLFIKTRALR